MDSFEGRNGEPLSLHKYQYANGNPANVVDPTGHDGDAISFSMSGNMAAGLAAFTAFSIGEMKTHAVGNLMAAAWIQTMAETESAVAAAESALSIARTSVRKLIEEAEKILNQTGRAFRQVKVVPVPRSVIPNVADHVATAQASGQPMVLTRVAPQLAAANRRVALAGRGPAGLDKSWDEYPFASGKDPRSPQPASVVAVPWLENCIQGGIISACYRLENITVGTPYIVVVIP